jgi:tight adherence protein C
MADISSLAGIAAIFMGLAVFFTLYAFMAPVVERKRSGSEGPVDEKDSIGKFAKPILNEFLPQLPPIKLNVDRRKKLEELIKKSGNPWRLNVEELIGLMIAFGLTGGIIGMMGATGGSIPAPPIVVVLIGVASGFYYPYSVYTSARQKRTVDVQKHLPEALDLLTVTLSAGETFQPAMISVIKQMPESLVKKEFKRIVVNMQSGVPLEKTLTDFADLTDSEEAASFSKAIIQSQKIGSDVTEVLAQQATFSRDTKSTRIETKIAKLNTTLFIPLSLTMLPAFLAIFIAPIFGGITA